MNASVPDIDLLDARPSWDDYYRCRLRNFGGRGLINRKDLLENHWSGVSIKACKALYNNKHVTGVRLPVMGFSQKWPLFWIPHIIKVEWELFGKLGGKRVE